MQFELCLARFYSRYLRENRSWKNYVLFKYHSKMIQEEIDILIEAYRNI